MLPRAMSRALRLLVHLIPYHELPAGLRELAQMRSTKCRVTSYFAITSLQNGLASANHFKANGNPIEILRYGFDPK